ncbi:hypothetical protein FNO01nite_12550 [Flavobacterium noncentrifugens]|uniref:Conserved repeat domain-containing protein/Por secretion system C-terminal sorting domain-containing protein n=1 Tax=Flavobacterium noncentrifugens TaxID=1128970 RepID=A0A1G8VMZ9_9FLAO|nr:T9SS type A sorting domain-containing protein [Flavobacterium noncentrifugens]GEP50583.1 hypothetical protein FNO01nite_12550 [Flavobacterium noncentrifugens]SDJ67448.1 conserved repeat domain-containing protein/Por secretion system C-terminal sorting domain-containing protein [Flavobacterium noncentrifugens]
MKKITFLLLFFATAAQAQTIVNIPDAGFKSYLLAAGFDTNGDNQIDTNEALAVTSMDVISSEFIFDLTGLSAFTNLTSLKCGGYYFDSIDMTALTHLVTIEFRSAQSVNVSGLADLKSLILANNSLSILDLTGLASLEYLDVSSNSSLSSLDLTQTPNLKQLICNDTFLSSLNVSNLTALTLLKCNDSELNSLIFGGNNNLIEIDCSNNNLTSLNVPTTTTLTKLNCNNNQLTSLNVASLTGLTFLQCAVNSIADLNVLPLTNLINFGCDSNQLQALDVHTLINLTDFTCGENMLTELNVAPLVNLEWFSCEDNQLTELDIASMTNLIAFFCRNNHLNALTFGNATSIGGLYCENNNISALELLPLHGLSSLTCQNNPIVSLDISSIETGYVNCGSPELSEIKADVPSNLNMLTISASQLPQLNLNNLSQLSELTIGSSLLTSLDLSKTAVNDLYLTNSPNLTYLNYKNGLLQFSNSGNIDTPNLAFVCADDFNAVSIRNKIISLPTNNQNVQVNSYCSFVPGGNYNTISGELTFDANNNGCNAADLKHPLMKITINDGFESGATFTSETGKYSFFTPVGSFTVKPQIENPLWFNVSPAQAVVNFDAANSSISTQNFCLTANGIHPDVEILILPVGIARPGFDADYEIICKNKGNQILSGTIAMTFDDGHTDFVSATPNPDFQNGNTISWLYNNFALFDSKSYFFRLNLNSPVEDLPVNDGDILNSSVNITAAQGDDIGYDNTFNLAQTVVNSHDPNDKTCLEGANLSAENIGKYLHYNINFENTGSADAVNIVVKDTINAAKFDINSLQVLNSSHPVKISVKENIVEFIFENINLPPSIRNPIGGHGNVLFKIKTNSNLPIDSSVENTANIYFDYNAPIVTNEAKTTFRLLNNQVFERDYSIRIHPNPAKDFVKIQSKNTIKTIDLFDVQGRILQTSVENKKETSIDLSQQSNGIYFLKITSEKGGKIEKIIKNN